MVNQAKVVGKTQTNGGTRRNYVPFITFRVVRDTAIGEAHVLDAPQKVADLAFEVIPDDAKEHFLVLLLDAQNALVAVHEVSVGTLTASLVSAREVFGPALRTMGVAALVLVHNHPSGSPSPSMEDKRLTRQLVEAARLLDLKIHDHVLIGNGQKKAWQSLAEMGLL
ncbi:Mov34/MPN/PAD-1 family protein [bacterium]|nr:Mov34/MPN/PAD-1 family protein [bacterium]